MSDSIKDSLKTGEFTVLKKVPPCRAYVDVGFDGKFCRDISSGWNVFAAMVSENVSTISAVSRPREKLTSLGGVVSGMKTAAGRASIAGIASARFSAGSVTTPSSKLI